LIASARAARGIVRTMRGEVRKAERGVRGVRVRLVLDRQGEDLDRVIGTTPGEKVVSELERLSLQDTPRVPVSRPLSDRYQPAGLVEGKRSQHDRVDHREDRGRDSDARTLIAIAEKVLAVVSTRDAAFGIPPEGFHGRTLHARHTRKVINS
jgi:hypothetical protein